MPECNCTDACERCYHYSDGSGGVFAPYIPTIFEGHDVICKKVSDPSIPASIRQPPSRMYDRTIPEPASKTGPPKG